MYGHDDLNYIYDIPGHKSSGHFKRSFVIAGVIAAVIVLLFLYFLPVRILIISDDMKKYEKQDFVPDGIRIQSSSILGRTVDITDFELTYDEQSQSVCVTSGKLSGSVFVPEIKIKSMNADYPDTVYQGDKLDDSKVSVTVVYDDGTEVYPDHISLNSDDVIMSDMDLDVTSSFGNTVLHIHPVMEKRVYAEYDKDVVFGDDFDKSAFHVFAEFDDDMKKELTDIDYDPPSVVDGVMDITVRTVFGNTSITLVPGHVKSITASYTKTVYEGDIFDPGSVKISVLFENGLSDSPSFTYDKGFKNIADDTDLVLATAYGDVKLSFQVIKVTEISSEDSVEGLKEGDSLNISSLTLIYSDGTNKDIAVKDLTINPKLSDPVKSGMNTYVFTYHNVEYSFIVFAAKLS